MLWMHTYKLHIWTTSTHHARNTTPTPAEWKDTQVNGTIRMQYSSANTNVKQTNTTRTQTINEYSQVGGLEEEFEDTKVVIKICKSKKDRHHNSQKKNDERQTEIYKTHTTKDRVTRTQLKTGDDHRYSVRISSSCFTSRISSHVLFSKASYNYFKG